MNSSILVSSSIRPNVTCTVAPVRAVADIRSEFPGIADGSVPLDGAAGTHVPQAVIDAIAAGLRDAMSNQGGVFAASERSSETQSAARQAIADLLGGTADGVVFGPNMTTLTFHMADTLAATWRPGDEVVVTSLDHDANVRPWLRAAERVGVTVRWAQFDVETGELAPEVFDALLSERTRLVAVTGASNSIGTRPDVRAIADRAHAVGALTYVDGVHSTPHVATDVAALGADFYACSTYKLFGPHAAAVLAAPELLESLRPGKLAPAPEMVPYRFERGTPAFELLAGITAAVDWIAGLADAGGGRRERIVRAYAAMDEQLSALMQRALAGLAAIDGVRLLGAPRTRTPTISFLVDGHAPKDVARALADRDIAVWSGDVYAYELMRRFGLGDSGGAVRASIVLYNDASDVDRLLEAVAELAG
jgi:cysteine desulfurase family protein (TIGR01976 family)